jgi:hypothetical protein
MHASSIPLTPAKGAAFNVQMLGEGYASHPDGSKGVDASLGQRSAVARVGSR